MYVSFYTVFETVNSILEYWIYPQKNIYGETGCYISVFLIITGFLQIQLHSFIMAITRTAVHFSVSQRSVAKIQPKYACKCNYNNIKSTHYNLQNVRILFISPILHTHRGSNHLRAKDSCIYRG